MNLDELKNEVSQDLPVADQEKLDTEALKNQTIKII